MFNKKIFFLFANLFLGQLCYSLPFSITPNGALPSTYPSVASYTITKNTQAHSTGNIIKWLPPNVVIYPYGTTCASNLNEPFDLSFGNQCTLNLYTFGPVSNADANPEHHLMVCLADKVSCAGPSPANSINTTQGNTNHFVTVGRDAEKFISYFSNDAGNNWVKSINNPPTPNRYLLLIGVSCDITGVICNTVGNYQDNSHNEVPYGAFSTNGGFTWQVSSPFPIINPGINNHLNATACSNNGLTCVIVGESESTNAQPLNYISQNGGQTWKLPSQLPQPISDVDRLSGVTCDADGIRFITVGSYLNNSTNYSPIVYISTNSGNTWHLANTLPPIVGTASSLYSIACSANQKICTTVGYYLDGFIDKPVSYFSIDGGETWQTSTQPEYVGNNNSILQSVTCDSTGLKCIAVGSDDDFTSAKALSYYSNNGGQSWSVSNLPTANHSTLHSVTCNKEMTYCSAVGTFYNGSRTVPLSYISTNAGMDWVLSNTLPSPQVGNTSTLAVG